MNTIKKSVTVTLDLEVWEKTKEIAQKEVRSFSRQVNRILKKYIRIHEAEKDFIR